MMLPSGADAAVTLAKKYFGSEENCAMAMNGRADTLGMHRTHFTNVTGLHDDAHYTTLEDMAKLLVYALDNQMFRKIFTTSVYNGVADAAGRENRFYPSGRSLSGDAGQRRRQRVYSDHS